MAVDQRRSAKCMPSLCGVHKGKIVSEMKLIRPPDVSGEHLKFYPWTFFFCFYQSTVLASSVLGKASTVGIEVSPTPPLIFTGGQKVRNLVSFKTSLKFEPSAFENAARYPKSKTKMQCCDDRPMSLPSLVKLVSGTSEKALSVLPHPLKLHAKTC